MRLLDTETGHFVNNPGTVPYAILSHVWDRRELSYQDALQIQNSSQLTAVVDEVSPSQSPTLVSHTSSAFSIAYSSSILDHPDLTSKVREACRVAREHGYRYIWIDSCCIDKTSSSELSEAINSMHRWYRDASVCYAFLADVPTANRAEIRSPGSPFYQSRWFTRGWTLQELIASRSLVFLSRDWVALGTKVSLVDVVETITGIDQDILRHQKSLDQVSVARRMSWASRRSTTRVEDEAYCLLGIFGINMETLYGEGRHAFFRLQEKILMQIPDQSIFAWGLPFPRHIPPPAPPEVLDLVTLDATLFARAPSDFAHSDAIVSLSHHGFRTKLQRSTLQPPEYSFSSYGLRTELPVVPAHAHYTTPDYVFVILACQHSEGSADDFIAVAFSVHPDASESHTQLVSAGLRWRPRASVGPFITCRLVALSLKDIQARQSPHMRDLLWSVYLPSYDRSTSESALITIDEADVLLAPTIDEGFSSNGYEVECDIVSDAHGNRRRRFSLRKRDIDFFLSGTYESSRHGNHVVVCMVLEECSMLDPYGHPVQKGSMLWIHSTGRTEVTWMGKSNKVENLNAVFRSTTGLSVSLAFSLEVKAGYQCSLVVEEISVRRDQDDEVRPLSSHGEWRRRRRSRQPHGKT
ncbi:heterokaryon incompatibility protein-domain-containing protein [Dichomitus squalens]|uniref:Heterokaryon incompatibility protein-domain-containing protein n=1 Tax=Dichomitus squalens TaxID=114155 RepID=A0A4Q9N6T4_9APHY|nr:heterokaryon incompatibility protein-domain-containing protein [Dichomitus squalens]